MRTNTLRACHVNAGTSVPADELPWPEDTDKPVLELPKLHVEIDRRSEVTPYGGLALAAQVAFLLKIPKILNRHVSVLKRHLPYHEWVAQLALPTEGIRWEWKRFRHAFVVVPAQVLRRAAQIWLRVSGSHRFARELLAAHVSLQR